MKQQSGKIPVTIVTGYLGSGKTTLINHLLSTEHGYKIAVIVNEFGEIGIDGDLIVKDENSILELSNGCLCCKVIGDLTQIILDLKKKEFDYLIIETTGIANPAPVAEVFYFDPRINTMFYVDGIVTVVDPINLERHLESSDECYKQIAFADLFILNKTDIAEENQLKQTQSLISHINPITKTIKAIRCEVNPKNILNLGAKTHTAKLLNCEDSNKAHEHHDNHQHGHEHNSPVHSISIQMDGEMDQAQLRYWISTLIFDRSDVIYRMKGIINVKGRDDKLVFQSVHRLFEDHLGGPWKANEKRNNRIVFIGEKLDKAELEEGLKSCLAH